MTSLKSTASALSSVARPGSAQLPLGRSNGGKRSMEEQLRRVKWLVSTPLKRGVSCSSCFDTRCSPLRSIGTLFLSPSFSMYVCVYIRIYFKKKKKHKPTNPTPYGYAGPAPAYFCTLGNCSCLIPEWVRSERGAALC